MQSTFLSASAFDGDVTAWDTSKVANMQSTFNSAPAFNGDIAAWDTSKVTSMERTFNSASAFNGDVSLWACAPDIKPNTKPAHPTHQSANTNPAAQPM